MKDIFPTPGGSVTVTDEMCDMNGHMNVRFYQTIPMDYEGNFYHSLGFGEDYISKGYSSFTIEQNISYLKECLKGEVLTPRFRMLNVNKKLYHYHNQISSYGNSKFTDAGTQFVILKNSFG